MKEISSKNGPYRLLFSELRARGYVEGDNLIVLRFSAEGDASRYDATISEVIAASPDVIVTSNNPLALRFKAQVHTKPIVALMADPVTFGLVSNLKSPEANLTGVSVDAGLEIWGKGLDLLIEAASNIRRAALLCTDWYWRSDAAEEIRKLAHSLSVKLIPPPFRGDFTKLEYSRALSEMGREQVDALLVTDGTDHLAQRELIVQTAREWRVPALYPWRQCIEIGGFMAYSVDLQELWRRAAICVDSLFKGAHPRDIPINRADKFTTIINLRAAKDLGLTVPPLLLARADEVIE